jgi:alditol oxidase
MSTAGGRASVAIHFTWQPDTDGVRRLLPIIEAALAPFDPRPHWGKVFTMSSAAVRATYPNLPQFVALLERHDPTGKVRNDFLERYIFSG